MSVNRPLSGWKAAFETRYDVASQERREKELKDEEMGAVRVATMVVSDRISFPRPLCGKGLTQGSEKHPQPYTAHNRHNFLPAGLFDGIPSIFSAFLRTWSMVVLKERCVLGHVGFGGIICRMLISRHLLDWLSAANRQPGGREEKMQRQVEEGGDCGSSRAAETLKTDHIWYSC